MNSPGLSRADRDDLERDCVTSAVVAYRTLAGIPLSSRVLEAHRILAQKAKRRAAAQLVIVEETAA